MRALRPVKHSLSPIEPGFWIKERLESAQIARDRDRSTRQGSAKRDSQEHHDDPRRRTGPRQIRPNGRTLLQYSEKTERALYLRKLRRTPNSSRTGHGRLRLGPSAVSRIGTAEIS